jgi:hypothetical protein
MTRPNRPRAALLAISGTAWAFLCDEPRPANADSAEWWALEADEPLFSRDGRTGAELWREHRAAVLAWWVGEHPGTRPRWWWRHDAPGPRQRLGGIGTPRHERLADVARYEFGLPVGWITQRDIKTYEALGPPLGVPPIDLNDPPLFESEAAYLDRIGLLVAGERKRLSAADFEPARVPTTDG